LLKNNFFFNFFPKIFIFPAFSGQPGCRQAHLRLSANSFAHVRIFNKNPDEKGALPPFRRFSNSPIALGYEITPDFAELFRPI